MTEPEPDEEQNQEPEECVMEGGAYLAGGVEMHARIVEEGGRPGVDFSFLPTVNDREIPEVVAEYNQVIERMCRETVTKFPDPRTLGRFYREVKKDGFNSRCWYKIIVTATVGPHDEIQAHVSDVIDPGLLRADPHVRFRARQLKAFLQRSMKRE